MSGQQEQAFQAVKSLQEYDPKQLARKSELGVFSFDDAVLPAQKLVGLFSQIPVQYIHELPDAQAQQLFNQANAILNRFSEIEDFDPTTSENPTLTRKNLTEALANSYQSVFQAIWQHIAYLASRERDFGSLEVEARAAAESAKRQAKDLSTALETQKKSAEVILDDIRKVAAEQGVSQQAIHFKNESELHATESAVWKTTTIKALGVIAGFGVLTIFLHKIPFLAPGNTYDAIQLAVSKVLIFAVLAYGGTLSAKNYLAHKHNEVVNRHRQNALATYKAIADAAHDEGARDIVLAHAADCIFSPQETGYSLSKGSGSPDTAPTLQVLPRLTSATDGTA